MTTPAQLLPCPFCGSTNINVENARDFIACRGCGTEGPCQLGQGSTSAIEAWNKRAAKADAKSAGEAREAVWYRWLRDHSYIHAAGSLNFGTGCRQTMPELLDEAIEVQIAMSPMPSQESPQ